MARYAKIDGNNNILQYPYRYSDLRADNPDVSFPREEALTAERLAEWGVVRVEDTVAPEIDHTQDLSEATPVLEQGVWKRVWVASDVDQATVDARIQKRRDRVNEGVARRMIASDWTQLADGPANAAAWATWRAAVRALWNAADPFAITWPTPPAGGRAEFLARLVFLRETED